jgi:hypothetical protein
MPDIDPDDIEAKILENQGLVDKIIGSAQDLSAPMSLAEFRTWLREGPNPAAENRLEDV